MISHLHTYFIYWCSSSMQSEIHKHKKHSRIHDTLGLVQHVQQYIHDKNIY